MTSLATLKLSTAKRMTHMPVVQQRRNKLVKRLWEQAELAKAMQAGSQFRPVKFRTLTDKETGQRKQVEVHTNVKPWWFVTDGGKLALSVRYGPKILELAKGKYAVEVAAEKDLVATLEVIKAAVQAGELDAAIEHASSKLRVGFAK